MRLEDFEETHNNFLRAKGGVPPLVVALAKLVEEAGEACEVLAAKNGSLTKTAKIKKKGQSVDEALSEECGDLIVAAFTFIRAFDLDPVKVMCEAEQKLKTRTARILGEKANGKK